VKVLVTGANGQVGRELIRCGWSENANLTFLTHSEFDISAPGEVQRNVERSFDIVINAAAYTAVDRAESEAKLAYRVNAEGPKLLANRCREIGVPLIHLSTDYVFDGQSGLPYAEEDEPSPLYVYGASKLAGELAVKSILDAHLIVRTASVFSEYGQNFVKTMLKTRPERPVLGVVADQRSCPTAAADIAAAVVLVVQRIVKNENSLPWGVYHFCGQPPVTWFQFAQHIFEMARDCGMRTPELRPITAAEYPSAAKRPAYSALDCSKIVEFGVPIPSWAVQLRDVISSISDRGLSA
jgi:dTDP-4-dehydrorhamnose reductase